MHIMRFTPDPDHVLEEALEDVRRAFRKKNSCITFFGLLKSQVKKQEIADRIYEAARDTAVRVFRQHFPEFGKFEVKVTRQMIRDNYTAWVYCVVIPDIQES